MKVNNLQIEQQTERATVYRLASGNVLAVAHPPGAAGEAIPTEVHEVAAIVKEAMAQVAVVDLNRRSVAEDRLLSDLGRQAKLAPILKAAKEGLAAAEAKLEAWAGTVDAAEARVYAPPQLRPDDIVGAIVDSELRSWIRDLRGNEREKALASLADEPRLAEAVLRSPTQLGLFSSHARDAWRRHVEATSPAAAQVALSRAALDWARNVMPAVAAALS